MLPHHPPIRTCCAMQPSIVLRHTPRPRPTTSSLRNTSTPLPLSRSPFLPPPSSLHTTPAPHTKSRAILTTGSPSKVLFTRDHVPPQSYFASQLRPPLVRADTTLTAESCHRAVTQYVDLALAPFPRWRDKLPVRDDDNVDDTPPSETQPQPQPQPQPRRKRQRLPSLETLHTAAAAMALGRTPAVSLGLHVLHTGVTRAYAPSVLTLARLALHSGSLGRPRVAPAEAALRRIAEGDADADARYAADACTLMGLIRAAEGATREDDDAALMWFRRAAECDAEQQRRRRRESGAEGEEEGELGEQTEDDADRWQWRSSFLLAAAKIRLKRGEPERARPLLQHAADVDDSAEACFLLSALLDADDDGAARSSLYLERAAVSGVQEACREIGTGLVVRAAAEEEDDEEKGLSRRERRDRRVIADEWLALAGDKALV